MNRTDEPFGALVAHTPTGVTRVPLTGDPRIDAALLRVASLGGPVTWDGVLVDVRAAEERAAIEAES